MDLGINGRIALVTGASRGLGYACAETLSKEGVRVAVCGRSADRINDAAKEIADQTGGEVVPFVADVSSSIKERLDSQVNHMGPCQKLSKMSILLIEFKALINKTQHHMSEQI